MCACMHVYMCMYLALALSLITAVARHTAHTVAFTRSTPIGGEIVSPLHTLVTERACHTRFAAGGRGGRGRRGRREGREGRKGGGRKREGRRGERGRKERKREGGGVSILLSVCVYTLKLVYQH